MRHGFSITRHPYRVELKGKTEYFFCRCGKSDTQPFCDQKSHRYTEETPLKFSVEVDGFYYLCGCKKSKHIPFCDGTHKE
ncbi:MAG: CDGSH iron-sulfur domain-containing protein [Acholeplasma sp.]|jgi:CDGSH-type Zn-finger protein|nr:MAG: CDGSH iron-sulfur domain-containing protein [Acholeplasma sp.]